jgi:CubicO group peptidase (beta-lactamase class C family)
LPEAELHLDAEELETLYGLLVVENDHLVAEKYFNGAHADQVSSRRSATKSFTSAMVGSHLEKGCLSSIDQRMMEFFPEFEIRIEDPRKSRSRSGTCCRCEPVTPGRRRSRPSTRSLLPGQLVVAVPSRRLPAHP